jgi:hypothetical protein
MRHDEHLKAQSMNDRRRFFRIFFMPTAFGVMSLLTMLSRGALSSIRGVDAAQLMGPNQFLVWVGLVVKNG